MRGIVGTHVGHQTPKNLNDLASVFGEKRFANFKAKYPFSGKLSNFANFATNIPYQYPKGPQKIAAQ